MAGVEMFPRGFGNVAFVLVAYCFLNFWMGFQVGKARKKYNVPYPTLYAIESENKDAKLFNCVQRGHQNSLELMPVFFLLMEIWALAFDRAYGVHNFIRNQSSSRKVLGPVTEKPVAAPPATSQATEGTKKSKERS
ncbi:microsomal glutathione S-transferase 3-like [Populus alba x Populus x berolinensis]|nr:microsomal glutathione S-transferase 3-like [Populus alba x Populus x berolinensis]